MIDHAAIRARVETGDIPTAGPDGGVDMALLYRAYKNTWVGTLIQAVYDIGHDEGESSRNADITHFADVDPALVVRLWRFAKGALVDEGRCPWCGEHATDSGPDRQGRPIRVCLPCGWQEDPDEHLLDEEAR